LAQENVGFKDVAIATHLPDGSQKRFAIAQVDILKTKTPEPFDSGVFNFF